jgi:arylsulfatase A-like enzyme
MAVRSRALSLALAIASAPLVLDFGCREADPPIAYELTELFPSAGIVTETAVIDFGAASSRARLGSGFSGDETATDGTSFVWSVGPSSSIDFVLSEPRPVTVVFRAWPFRYDSAPVQTLRFELNSGKLGPLELSSEPNEYRLRLPETLLRTGHNRLRVSYSYERAPRDVLEGSADARPLAVGWDWMRFEGIAPTDPPRASSSGDEDEAAIFLPAASSVSYYLDLAPGSLLGLEGVRALSETTARGRAAPLRIEIETPSERLERTVDAGTRRFRLPLPRDGGWTALRFHATSEGFLLRKPAVRSPPLARSTPSPEAIPSSTGKPDVVLILIDTLRADHLGCYGYEKETTPNLDRLSADATLFENAVAQSSWTRPSVASIMTGLTPRAHLTNERDDAIPEGLDTVAEQLAARGYETAGFVTNTNVAPDFGFDRGFGTYELLLDEDPRLGYARADVLVDRALDFLSRRRSEAPLFLYLHATDPHDPYSFSRTGGDPLGTMGFMKSLEAGNIAVTPGTREGLIDRYDREIRFADREIGRFLDSLKERATRPTYRDALVIVLSDHGEEFQDHGWWRHGKTLYQELLHVPLLVKWPSLAFAGARNEATVQHIDLLPTLLDLAGSPAVEWRALPGRSLWPLVSGRGSRAPVAARSYLHLDGREVESVTLGKRKLVRYFTYDREKPTFELFDLDVDPKEATNRAREGDADGDGGGDGSGAELDFLRGLLELPPRGPQVTRAPAVIDEETQRRLRALGYIP